MLPTLLGVLLLAAAAAIIVSTANSMLLSPATNLVRDVYQRFLESGRQRTPDRAADAHRRSSRSASSALVAGSFFPTVLAMALWAYTMYGAGITPALLAALVWPRAPKAAGIYSIAAGMSVTLLWELPPRARTRADPLGCRRSTRRSSRRSAR